MRKINLVLIFTFFLISCCFGQENDTTIYRITEILPSFKYKDCEKTYESCEKFFMENFKMPKELLDDGFTGKIYIQFVVEKDGTITERKLIRGINSTLDSLVLESVKSMPKWDAGKIRDKRVRTYYSLPVSIRWLYYNREDETK